MRAWLRRVCRQWITATFVGVGLSLGLCAGAQGQAQISDAALLRELQTLFQRAGTVFVGQIVTIERKPGCVEVVFRVEQPVRGLTGSPFVMREWTGLWAPGFSRYREGQRVLAFVYAAGRGGLSSPVFGPEGLVPVAVDGADQPELLDIRRVAASVVRSATTPLPTEGNGAFRLPEVLEFFRGQRSAADVARVALPGSVHPVRARLPSGLGLANRPRPVHVSDGQSAALPQSWGSTHGAR